MLKCVRVKERKSMDTIVKTHVGAYGIVIRENKIALIKKARGGYKGKYDLPGGGIEHDETPIMALQRELMEEIGGLLRKQNYWMLLLLLSNGKWKSLIEDLHHVGILYTVKIEEDNLKVEADGLDSDGAVWMELDKLTEDMLSPFAWYSLKKLMYK